MLPYLRERIITSAEEGVPVRAILLCNPHNPIPQCYPTETIQGHLDLAEEVRRLTPSTRSPLDRAETTFSVRHSPHL